MPVVVIPTAYRGPTQGLAEVSVQATRVGDALVEVDALHPGFRELIFDASGDLHRFVKLFINEEQIDPTGLDKPLGVDDRLEVLAAIAGG